MSSGAQTANPNEETPRIKVILGALKSPGSNESQGGGGLELLPGAIGVVL
jgi:hypothetical protein